MPTITHSTKEPKDKGRGSLPTVLYHANCPDGFCAAWAARRALHDCIAIPVNYGTEPPWEHIRGRDVAIVDFSYPRAVLEAIHEDAHSLVVLDHHKTAAADLAGLPYVKFDQDHSGAYLAWTHFNQHQTVPDLVRYVEDRDLWRFKLESSKEVSAGLRLVPYEFEAWDILFGTPGHIATLRDQGKLILKYDDQILERQMANVRFVELKGYKVAIISASVLQSELGNLICKRLPEVHCCLMYFDRPAPDGSVRQWSLRSIGDVDVSKIAQEFGGGGHKNAAGFETDVSWMPLFHVKLAS